MRRRMRPAARRKLRDDLLGGAMILGSLALLGGWLWLALRGVC